MEKVEVESEGLADWAALESSITAPAGVPGAEAAPVIDAAKSWAEIPALVGSILAMALPEVRAFYTKEACQEWGEKMVPVAEELGWDVSEVMGPKMALAVASAPFIMGPIMIVRARKAQAEQAAPKQPAPGELVAEGAGQKSVIVGSPAVAE